VALLVKDRETSPPPADQPPAGAISTTAPDFACEVCGAAMERGQDWCLECGTAAPGRLGARPGWRAAFTVVGLTTLLLACAVVAAYAALTSDAERTASAPVTADGNPIVAQTPGAVPGATPGAVPVQPGATGPNTAPPASSIPKPIIPVQPTPPAKNTPLMPPAAPSGAGASKGSPGADGAGTGSSGTTGATGSTGATGATTQPGVEQVIAFGKDAAKTYNQPARAGAEFGPAAYAVDATPSTVWDVVVPADGQPIGAGLVIDLGKPYALSSLRLTTPTPGFTVEIYGAKSAKQLPVDVIDKRWIHLTDKKGVQSDEPITLKNRGDGAKVQLLLLHMTAPAQPTDPKVAIGNVALRGTP
jgi:hypothetical protein